MRAKLLIILACSLTAGCGAGSPFDYETVSGRVTYDDGTLIPTSRMQLRFEAQDAASRGGAFPRPAVANVDATGHFDCVTSYKYGDGLIPGRHKVAISAGSGPNGKSVVPEVYASIATTPLVIDTATAPLEIRVPRP